MKKRGHLFEIRGTTMIYNFDATEIGAFALCGLSNGCFVSEQSNTSHPIARANCRGNDRARIVSFRQDYVLELCGGALADSFKYGHGGDVRIDPGGTFS